MGKLKASTKITEKAVVVGRERAVILTGRLTYVFLHFLAETRRKNIKLIADESEADESGMGKIIYKYLRLRHHPAGEDATTHIIGYAVISLAGEGECGFSRDDGRVAKHEVEFINGRKWYKFPCSKNGCAGAAGINAEGIPVIAGILEYHHNGEWIVCKEIEGCAII